MNRSSEKKKAFTIDFLLDLSDTKLKNPASTLYLEGSALIDNQQLPRPQESSICDTQQILNWALKSYVDKSPIEHGRAGLSPESADLNQYPINQNIAYCIESYHLLRESTHTLPHSHQPIASVFPYSYLPQNTNVNLSIYRNPGIYPISFPISSKNFNQGLQHNSTFPPLVSQLPAHPVSLLPRNTCSPMFDLDKWCEAMKYCNSNPLYQGGRLKKNPCLFDPETSKFPQKVIAPLYRNGFILYRSWYESTQQSLPGGIHGAWRNDKNLQDEFEKLIPQIKTEHVMQLKMGYIIYKANARKLRTVEKRKDRNVNHLSGLRSRPTSKAVYKKSGELFYITYQ